MTIQQCKYVLEIFRKGSFNEAAKSLFVAQSSLSASVKSLEQELNIKIFERASNGVCLTCDGAEFVRYASQIVEQNDFILGRYRAGQAFQRLYIATQHYDFVADIFGKLINSIEGENYRIALKETKTYEVIQMVEDGYSDIGIIALKNTNYDIMKRFLANNRLRFHSFLKVSPHVFLRRNHPLAENKSLTYGALKPFPYVSYEQGSHNSSFFTEEFMEETTIEKHIEISDRASLMNVLLITDGYTIGTGLMPSALNEGKILSIPLESDCFYNIGYILHAERKCSELAASFIDRLQMLAEGDAGEFLSMSQKG